MATAPKKSAKELTNDDLAQAIEDALALMNDQGAHWIKGALRRTDRKTKEVSYCSVGAIRAVTKSKSRLKRAAISVLADAIGGYGGDVESGVIAWNDSPSRTWKDVSRAFRKAAKNLRARKSRSPYLP